MGLETMLVVEIVGITALLLLAHAGLRRARPWVLWVCYSVVPVLFTPYWIVANSHTGPFLWIKLYLVVATMIWFTALQTTRLAKHQWARVGVTVLIFANILQAILLDLCCLEPAHHLVAIAGALLLGTLANPTDPIEVPDNRFRDLHYRGMTRRWILAYSVWNWSFLYLNVPEIAGPQIGVLAAALIIGMVDPRLWVLAHGRTLLLALILWVTFPQSLGRLLDTSNWSSPLWENVVAAVCVIIVVACTARYRRRHGIYQHRFIPRRPIHAR